MALSIPLGTQEQAVTFAFTSLKVSVMQLVWEWIKAMNLASYFPLLQGLNSHRKCRYIFKKNRLHQNIPVLPQPMQVLGSL